MKETNYIKSFRVLLLRMRTDRDRSLYRNRDRTLVHTLVLDSLPIAKFLRSTICCYLAWIESHLTSRKHLFAIVYQVIAQDFSLNFWTDSDRSLRFKILGISFMHSGERAICSKISIRGNLYFCDHYCLNFIFAVAVKDKLRVFFGSSYSLNIACFFLPALPGWENFSETSRAIGAEAQRQISAVYQLNAELNRDKATVLQILRGLNDHRVRTSENLASISENIARIANSLERR